MRLASLDIATHTGWATEEAYGVWDLTPKRDESKGMRVIRFRSKLLDLIDSGVTIIVYERPAGMHKSSIITQSELVGVLKLVCEEKGIEYRAYSAPEIKKYATGKGNCNKAMMVKTANEKYDLELTDDNIADAVHLYHLAKEDLKI